MRKPKVGDVYMVIKPVQYCRLYDLVEIIEFNKKQEKDICIFAYCKKHKEYDKRIYYYSDESSELYYIGRI